MLISVLICTRDRKAALERCLQKFDQDGLLRVGGELVIVDNGSTDGTAELIEAFRNSARVPVRALHEERAGLSRARNAGLAAVAGEIIVFLDDDCYLDEGYLDTVARLIPKAEYSFAGGRIKNFDPSQSGYGSNLKETFEYFPPRSFIRAGTFQGTNLVMKREVIQAVGEFDTKLGAGTPFRSEDIDYCARASMAGFASAHVPELLVYHHHGRHLGPERNKLAKANLIAAGAYYTQQALRGHLSYLTGWIGTIGSHERGRDIIWELWGALQFLWNHPTFHRRVRMPFFQVRNPRDFQAFAMGTSKSGTHSLYAMAQRDYWSLHEPDDKEAIETILHSASGELATPALRKWLRERDTRMYLEMDASNLNIHFLRELVELFPKSKYILTIRDCVAWVDSEINHMLAHPYPEHWRRMWNHRYGADVNRHAPEEAILKEHDLYTLDGYMKYWAWHNATAIATVPKDRLLVIKTKDISHSTEKIATFLGISHETLALDRSHTFSAAKKFHILEKVDPDFVHRKALQHARGVMEQIFPGELEKMNLVAK